MRMCCFEAICFFLFCCCCCCSTIFGEKILFTHIFCICMYTGTRNADSAHSISLPYIYTGETKWATAERPRGSYMHKIQHHDITKHIHVPATNERVCMASRLATAALSAPLSPSHFTCGLVCVFHEIETDFVFLFHSQSCLSDWIVSIHSKWGKNPPDQMTYESFEMNLLFVTKQMV